VRSVVLVTEPGDGHALVGGLSPCVAAIGTRYLVDLQVPARGTTCP
jgi:TAP-like protein